MRDRILIVVLLFAAFCAAFSQNAPSCCPEATNQKQQLLWQKLEAQVQDTDKKLDGVMGVSIMDLSSGQTMLLHGDEVFAQASSIKTAVLAELYRQAAQGKLKLTEMYTVRKSDMVQDGDIYNGLTPGVTQVTLRDLATMMIAVSDNSATNVLIDRVGMENVNAMLRGLGLKNTLLRRKMMDVKAASEGRENISTPREMMALLQALYSGKLFGGELKDDFFGMLATHKESPIRRVVPEEVVSADKPGELEAIRNDSGIVFVTNRPFVICVMTGYLRHETDGEAAIAKIASAAYDYFDRIGRATEYGRVVSTKNSATP
jgi:beta-lactamase class A